jgi:hypothetical protein
VSLFAVTQKKYIYKNSTLNLQIRPYTLLFLLLFVLTVNGFLPGGSGSTIRHNTQITHITQNNTPHLNKTQHTKLHKQQRTHYTQ